MKNYLSNNLTMMKRLRLMTLSSLISLVGISSCDSLVKDSSIKQDNANSPVDASNSDVEPQSKLDSQSSLDSSHSVVDDSTSTPEGITQVANSNNQFAISMYKQINKVADASNDNVFISPYSLSSAMAMLYNGAEGDSKRQIAHTFYYSEVDVMNPSSASLREHLDQANDGYDLITTNQFWITQSLKPKQTYVDTLQRYYDAKVTNVNFEGQPNVSRQLINDDIVRQTQQMVKDLLPEGSVNVSTVSVLTNAIYFKGDWQSQFEPSDTTDMPFYPFDNQPATANMMFQKLDFGYMENTKGLIRKYLPKGSAFTAVCDEQIQAIEDRINNRPRKRLAFKTPNQVFFNIT